MWRPFKLKRNIHVTKPCSRLKIGLTHERSERGLFLSVLDFPPFFQSSSSSSSSFEPSKTRWVQPRRPRWQRRRRRLRRWIRILRPTWCASWWPPITTWVTMSAKNGVKTLWTRSEKSCKWPKINGWGMQQRGRPSRFSLWNGQKPNDENSQR